MEFTEYRAITRTGENWIARKLPKNMDGHCVVSHPDAGGPCWEPIVYEVYGLPFCEAHGLEANAGALAQLYDEAADEFQRLNHPHLPAPHPEVLRVSENLGEHMLRNCSRYSDSHEELARRAFPLIEERVDVDTKDWDPGEIRLSPVDVWLNWYRQICSFMLQTRCITPDGVLELEGLRERAAAQYAFAEVIGERKIEACKAARG